MKARPFRSLYIKQSFKRYRLAFRVGKLSIQYRAVHHIVHISPGLCTHFSSKFLSRFQGRNVLHKIGTARAGRQKSPPPSPPPPFLRREPGDEDSEGLGRGLESEKSTQPEGRGCSEGATKGLSVFKGIRSRWTKRLTYLEYSNGSSRYKRNGIAASK